MRKIGTNSEWTQKVQRRQALVNKSEMSARRCVGLCHRLTDKDLALLEKTGKISCRPRARACCSEEASWPAKDRQEALPIIRDIPLLIMSHCTPDLNVPQLTPQENR